MKYYVLEVFNKKTGEHVGYITKNSTISKFMTDAIKYDMLDIDIAYKRSIRFNTDSTIYDSEVKLIC